MARKAGSGKKPPKWQIIENIIAHIEQARGANANWKMTQKALVPEHDNPEGKGREVDVFLECPSGTRTFRFGIDVKDESRPLDVESMDALIAKRQSIALDRYAVIARSGYTAEARRKAGLSDIELFTFEEADRSDFFVMNTVGIRTTTVTVDEVLLMYLTVMPPLPLDRLAEALIETNAGERASVTQVAHAYGTKQAQEQAQKPGTTATGVHVTIMDQERHWRGLLIGDAVYPAPDGLDAVFTFTVREERVPTTRVVTSDGLEASAAIVPYGEEFRQLTFIAHPGPDGSQISISVGPVQPPQVRVHSRSGPEAAAPTPGPPHARTGKSTAKKER